jgi:hypothetical protein
MEGVRASRPSLSLQGLGPALKWVGVHLREAVLIAGPIAVLESVGPLTHNDAFDLMLLFGVVLAIIVLAQAARTGWMPLTVHALERTRGLGHALLRRLSPRYAVAFRPSPDALTIPDSTLNGPIAVATVLFLALGALGTLTFDGLTFVKDHVSYTLYLAGLVTVWALMLLTILLCAVSLQQGLVKRSRQHGGSPLPYVLSLTAWLLGMVALALVPGAIAVAALLIIGWFGGRSLQTVPQQNYIFCRRDGEGLLCL